MELAEHFLAGHPELDTGPAREDLAYEIQASIDTWLYEWRNALPGR